MSEVSLENWIKWVALTTTILAVCAAISALKGGSYSTRVQLSTTRENDLWAYYQSKGVKQHLIELERDLFKLELLKDNPAVVKEDVQGKMKSLSDNSVRYENEKTQIKGQIDQITKTQTILNNHGSNFGLAVMFFQIAIMLSAIGSLVKQRAAWICGLAIGAIGLIYFINGFFLVF